MEFVLDVMMGEIDGDCHGAVDGYLDGLNLSVVFVGDDEGWIWSIYYYYYYLWMVFVWYLYYIDNKNAVIHDGGYDEESGRD